MRRRTCRRQLLSCKLLHYKVLGMIVGRDQKETAVGSAGRGGVALGRVAGADARWSWLSLHAHYVRRRHSKLYRICRNDRNIVCFLNITHITQHHPWLGRRVGLAIVRGYDHSELEAQHDASRPTSSTVAPSAAVISHAWALTADPSLRRHLRSIVQPCLP